MSFDPNQAPGLGRRCRYCHANMVSRARGLQGPAEMLICLVLTFLGIIPGIIYYVYVESIPYCNGCGRRVR